MGSPKTAVAKAVAATIVHAYRRVPHMVPGPNGVDVEKAVEVVACGEKIAFKSNEQGHIVGEVKTGEALHRLVKEIPEAYIVYAGGDNVPEKPAPGAGDIVTKPEGAFVLESGDGADKQYKVLDDLSDEALRAFAGEAGLEDFPEAVKGEDLRRAIFNQLGGVSA